MLLPLILTSIQRAIIIPTLQDKVKLGGVISIVWNLTQFSTCGKGTEPGFPPQYA